MIAPNRQMPPVDSELARDSFLVFPATPQQPDPSDSPAAGAESGPGILFGVVKVSADARLTGPRPFRPNRAHASRNSPSTRLAILIGMSVVALTVGLVTIMIHDRIQ
jgi:hypothetical protein